LTPVKLNTYVKLMPQLETEQKFSSRILVM
jgi:hypothetical protein